MFINTLNEAALRILKKVAQLPQIPDFYLAGGSAAALYLDFFTEHESYESEPLIQSIQSVGNLKLQQQSRGTLVGLLDNVQISFFTYPYALLEVPGNLEGVRIASLLDISRLDPSVKYRNTGRTPTDGGAEPEPAPRWSSCSRSRSRSHRG